MQAVDCPAEKLLIRRRPWATAAPESWRHCRSLTRRSPRAVPQNRRNAFDSSWESLLLFFSGTDLPLNYARILPAYLVRFDLNRGSRCLPCGKRFGVIGLGARRLEPCSIELAPRIGQVHYTDRHASIGIFGRVGGFLRFLQQRLAKALHALVRGIE